MSDTADIGTQKIISFLLENRPLECTLCEATVAFRNKNTGVVVGVCFSRCQCLTQFVWEAPPSPQDFCKDAATPNKKEEDYMDRGSSKGDFGTGRKQEELEEDPMKERIRREEETLKNEREEEALKKEREEEASKKRREHEEALQKQREVEEARKKQIEVEALRKLQEEEARKKLEEDEARKREDIRLKLAAEKEEAEKAKAESMRKAIAMAEMDLSDKTWTGMKYSPNLKSGSIVHVVFAWNPIDYHVVCDQDSDLLVLLQEDLSDRVIAGKLKTINGRLQRDDVVIAEYDGAFYRARVSGASSTQCQLNFIDFGDKTIKKYDEIYEIPDDLYKTPIYGLKVRLDGLDPADLSVEALLSDTDASVYETPYTLELVNKLDMKDMYTRGILRDICSGQTLNDVVETNLQKF